MATLIIAIFADDDNVYLSSLEWFVPVLSAWLVLWVLNRRISSAVGSVGTQGS